MNSNRGLFTGPNCHPIIWQILDFVIQYSYVIIYRQIENIINILQKSINNLKTKANIKRFALNLMFPVTSFAIAATFGAWLEKNYSDYLDSGPDIARGLMLAFFLIILPTLAFVIFSSEAKIKSKYIMLFILNCLSLLYILEFWPNVRVIDICGIRFNSWIF